MSESPDGVFIALCNFEVKGKGIAIYGMGEEEIIRYVTFHDAEERFKLSGLLEFELTGKYSRRVFGGDEGLVLNEAG